MLGCFEEVVVPDQVEVVPAYFSLLAQGPGDEWGHVPFQGVASVQVPLFQVGQQVFLHCGFCFLESHPLIKFLHGLIPH